MKTLSDLEQQVFLVSKGHYRQPDKVETLRKVIQKLCWIDSVSHHDLYGIVLDVFLEHVKLSHQKDALRWCFNFGIEKKTSVSIMDMTEWMMGAISTIQILKGEETLYDLKVELLDIDN